MLTFKIPKNSLLQRIALCFVLCLIGMSKQVLAATCSSIYSGPATSWSATGNVYFGINSKLVGSSGTIDIGVPSGPAAGSGERTCDTQNCVSSGNTVSKLNPRSFSRSPYSTDIYLAANRSGSISQGYYDNLYIYSNAILTIENANRWTAFDYVSLSTNATLILDQGIYWFEYLKMADNSTLRPKGNGKVTLLVETVELAQDIRMNWDGDTDQLVIIAYGDLNFASSTYFKGYIHSKGDVDLDQNSQFIGGVNADDITLGANTKVTYDGSALFTAPFYDLCDDTDVLPEPIGHWPMDLCGVSPGTGKIEDEIAANDADVIGDLSIGFDGKHCQSAVFSGNKDYIDIPHNSDYLLAQGAVSFWINTDDIDFAGTASTGYMTLLSKDASGTSGGGHLTIWLTDSGTIIVRHQSSSNSYYIYSRAYIRENRWHHIGYSWGSTGLRLYIDGRYRGINTRYVGGIGDSTLPITLGANAWQFNPSSGSSKQSQLRDFYKGQIDDVKLFDEQLTATQMEKEFELASIDCPNCLGEPQLISHWNMDLCSLTGSSEQVVDVASGYNGIAVNSVSIDTSGRFCQALSFDGQQAYVNIPHNPNMQIANGAISMWFKVDDLAHTSYSRNGGNVLLSKDATGYIDGGHVLMRVLNTGAIQVRHQKTDGQKTLISSAGVITAGQWHFLTYTFGSQGMEIYIDGVEVAESPTFTTGMQGNEEPLIFGASARDRDSDSVVTSELYDFLKGDIDHVKLFVNQPTAADVSQWYTESSYDCATCDTLVAKYEFNEARSSTTITVEDTSGQDNDATLFGLGTTYLPAPNISCQALQVPDNDSSAFDGLNTGIDVTSDIGPQGSISFWYKANEDWQGKATRMLFDATRQGVSSDPSSARYKYFFLSLDSSGRLRFGLDDANDGDLTSRTPALNFVKGEWIYISATWDLVSKKIATYVNGVDNSTVIENDLTTAAMAQLNPLIFGDSDSDYGISAMSKNSADGDIDSIKIYNQTISQAQVMADMQASEPCVQVHHYEIQHPQSAVTCGNPEVVVKACADEACQVLYDDIVNVQLSPDIYDGGTAISFVGDTVLTLNNRTAGEITLGMSSADPVAPLVCNPDCTIDYSDAGIEFFNTKTGGSTFDLLKLVAQNPLSEIGVRAVSNNSGTCEALSDVAQNVELTYECKTSAIYPYTSSQCKVPFAGIPLSSASQHSGTISLTFDANGEATLGAYNYADVGQLALSIGATIDGAIIQPNQIVLNIVPDSLEMTTTATSPITAGDAFGLTIKALGSAGAVLPSYQPGKLDASMTRQIPVDSGSVDAQFYAETGQFITTDVSQRYQGINGVSFRDGVFSSSSAYFEEVGSYLLEVKDSNYLNYTIDANALSFSNVIPAYFDVQTITTPSFADSCSSSFTYVGQEFGFDQNPSIEISAYNSQGDITRNYAKSLWKLAPSQQTYEDEFRINDKSVYSGGLSTDLQAIVPITSGTDEYDGKGLLTITGSLMSYNKVVSPTGVDASPFESDVSVAYRELLLTDADGVCYQSNYPTSGCEAYRIHDVVGTQQRYGRLSLTNSFGPETHWLNVPIKAEYLVDGMWRLNEADSCTEISLLQTSDQIEVLHDSQSENNIANMITTLQSSGVLSSGVSDTNDLKIMPLMTGSVATSGSANIFLVPKTNASNWANHLNIDWDGDGDIDLDDQPGASVTFGLFRGNDRTIHWREVFND